MARIEPFNRYLNDYEDWFKEHKYVYESELEAVRHFIPKDKKGIEIGIGTGRFALPFGIREGVEPSIVMRHFALHKGLEVYDGIAEKLPLADDSYDFVSPLGKTYEIMKDQNKFYRYATFYSTDEVKKLLKENCFKNIEIVQTVFGDLAAIHNIQLFKEGYGEGGFVVINAVKEID